MNRRYWVRGLSLFCSLASCGATTITGNSTGQPPSISQDNYTVTLTPPTVQPISSSSDSVYGDLNVLRNEYNANTNWTFSPGSDGTGTFDVLQYSPFITQGVGGANFEVIYDDGVAAPADNYEWIQIAHYYNWGNDGTGTSDDSTYADFPFYGAITPTNISTLTTDNFPSILGSGEIWLQGAPNYPATKIQDPVASGDVPGGDLLFTDQPHCSLTCADTDGLAYAFFDLYLVTYTWNGQTGITPGSQAGGTIQILDGIRWGVEITETPTIPGNPGNLPEPSTCLLMGSGLVLMAWRVRGRLRLPL